MVNSRLSRRACALVGGVALAAAAALPLNAAAAPVPGDPTWQEGQGAYVIAEGDHWTANVRLDGVPRAAALNDTFDVTLSVYQSSDDGLSEEDAQGVLIFGATPGIVIDSITWECTNIVAESENPDDPDALHSGCQNDPRESLSGADPITVDDVTYTTRMVSPYILPMLAGWDLRVSGHYTELGTQRFLVAGVDASELDSDDLGAMLASGSVSQGTLVSEDGTEMPAQEENPIVNAMVEITQDAVNLTSGLKRTYTATFTNNGYTDMHDAHLQGLYLVLPEEGVASTFSVSCDEDASTAPCPAWANGEVIEGTEHDHGHDHEGHDHDHAVHNVGIFANTFDDVTDIPAGTSLVLRIEMTTTADVQASQRVREVTMDVTIAQVAGAVISDDSTDFARAAGTLVPGVVDHDEDADHDHDHDGDADHDHDGDADHDHDAEAPAGDKDADAPADAKDADAPADAKDAQDVPVKVKRALPSTGVAGLPVGLAVVALAGAGLLARKTR